MASNLTAQVRNIAEVTIAVASGDLSRKITVDVRGEILQLKEAINTMVDQLRSFASEVTRVAREVSTDGKLGGQAVVPGVAGTWKDLTDSVNARLESDGAGAQHRRGDHGGGAWRPVAQNYGRRARRNPRAQGHHQYHGGSVACPSLPEVTRVAREVGTEGKLGGQAQVPGVGGTGRISPTRSTRWRDLTGQVRKHRRCGHRHRQRRFVEKITVNVSREILLLKETVNTMVDQLNAFAGEVTRVARVGATDAWAAGQRAGRRRHLEGLTGQCELHGQQPHRQVRSNIAEVTTAVARGDLSRKITVDVKGEILELKNTINTMVDQLNAFAGR